LFTYLAGENQLPYLCYFWNP